MSLASPTAQANGDIALVPLVADEGYPPSTPPPTRLSTVRTILYEKAPDMTSRCACISHVVAKIFIAFLCYSSGWSSINASKKNFTNPVLQNLFAYGDFFAWGTVFTWCAFNLYTHVVERRDFGTERTMSTRMFLVYWTSVVALGLVSEISTAYNSWFYNEDTLFWCIYTPLVYSVFSMQSTDEQLQAIPNTNNLITRRLYKPETLTLIDAKNHFCQLIAWGSKALSRKMTPEIYENFKKINDEEKLVWIARIAVCEILKEGIIHRNHIAITKKSHFPRIERGVEVVATGMPFASPILDSILIVKGYELILKPKWPLPFIILFSVGPGIFLQVKLSQRFYTKLFNKITRQQVCEREIRCKMVASMIAKLVIISTFTVLGLAADTTVSRDNIGFKNIFTTIFCISVISTMGIILITSMQGVAKDLHKFVHRQNRTVEQIKQDDFTDRIDALAVYARSITKGQFQNLLQDLQLGPEDIILLSKGEFDINDAEKIKFKPQEQREEERVILDA